MMQSENAIIFTDTAAFGENNKKVAKLAVNQNMERERERESGKVLPQLPFSAKSGYAGN